MTTEEKTETPAEAMAALGLTVEVVFVPWSQSRSKDDRIMRNGKATKHPEYSLNWRVTLTRPSGNPADAGGRAPILTTDYRAGIGHCPSYKAPISRLGHANSVMRHECIARECETGRPDAAALSGSSAPIMPDPLDVLSCLLMDGEAIEYPTYEDWADSFGYDKDSRKGEEIYKACLETGLRLRAGLGEPALERLRLAFRDY